MKTQSGSLKLYDEKATWRSYHFRTLPNVEFTCVEERVIPIY